MRSSVRSLLLPIALLICCSWLQGQTLKTTSVTGPRPLQDVILQWEKLYGWVITYEDPRFEYANDVEDVTTKVRKDLTPGEPIDPSKRIIGARERQLSVTYNVPQSAKDSTARLESTKQLVTAYANDTGTTFNIERSENRLHVLPGLVRDAAGELQLSKPIMDTVITMPAQDRDGIEFMHALCDALTSATAHKVFIGMMPFNAMAQFHIKTGYENLPARRILEDFLNKMPRGERYTWALLFQKDYALNIHWVKDPYEPAEAFPPKESSAARSKFIEERTQTNGTTTVRVVR